MAPPRKNKRRKNRGLAATATQIREERIKATVVEPASDLAPPRKGRLAQIAGAPATGFADGEPWTRRQLAILVACVLALQPIIGLLLYLNDHQPIELHLTIYDPVALAVSPMVVMPLARRLAKVRAMRLVESVTFGALLSVLTLYIFAPTVANFVLGSDAVTTTSPAPSATATATASASASPSHTVATSAAPRATASAQPTATSAPTASPVRTSQVASPRSSATGSSVASSHPSPSPGTGGPPPKPVVTAGSPPVSEGDVIGAVALGQLAGCAATIMVFPSVHRFFWKPARKAREREAAKKAGGKNK